MTPILKNEHELYFERGGPVYRLMQRIGLIRGDDPSIRRRIVVFLALTWFPLLILSSIDGQALGPTPRQSFLLDFASWVRFFIAVPLLFVAEVVVGPRLTTAGLHFQRAGFVRPEDYPAFDEAIARAVRWRESRLAELIILGLALAGSWTFTTETLYGGKTATWHTLMIAGDSGVRVSLAGLWYRSIAVPILQFFWYRWLWRLIVWMRFLLSVSRLNLDLVPTHADEAGGLGFLGGAHTSFALFAFIISALLSADAAFRIVFENAPIQQFQNTFIALLVIAEFVVLGPLLVFSPMLARIRRAWMREYGLLVVRYNRAFHEKWVGGRAPENEPFLGSADIQSLADLGNSFQFIRAMKLVPFSQKVILQLAVAVAAPALPLLLLVMPIERIFGTLARAVF